MRNPLQQLLAWLTDAAPLWIGLLTAAAFFVLLVTMPLSEVWVRFFGMFFQLAGIFIVWVGVDKTRTAFGIEPYSRWIRSWLKRFPFRRRSAIAAGATLTLKPVLLSGRGHTSFQVPEAGTLEEKVNAIAKILPLINERISNTQSEIDRLRENLIDKVARETAERKYGLSVIREELVATATGGAHITLLGAWWLFVGVILTSIPQEISALVQ